MKIIIITTSLIVLFCNSLFANNIPDHLFGIWIHGRVSSDIESDIKDADTQTYIFDLNVEDVPDIFYTDFIKSSYFSDDLYIEADKNFNIKNITGYKHFNYKLLSNNKKFKTECNAKLMSVIEILNAKHGKIEFEREVTQASVESGVSTHDVYIAYSYENELTLHVGCQYFGISMIDENNLLRAMLGIYLSNSIEKFPKRNEKILEEVNFELLLKDSSGL